MKKTYLIIAALLTLLMGSANVNAQTISSVTITDSCKNIRATTNLSSPSANLKTITYWGDGTSTPVVPSPSITSFGVNHQYTGSGTYTIKTVLFLNNAPIDSTINSHSIVCSYIQINTYLDNNNNCLRDTGEPPVLTGRSLEVDSAGVIIDTITMVGWMYYKAKTGVIYKFKVLNQPLGTTATCPSSGIITVTGPAANSSTTIDLGFQCGSSSQFDLGVYLTGRFRSVTTSMLTVLAYNNSCSSQNGVVTVNVSNKYKYNSAYPAPANVTGNTVTWNVNNLSTARSQSMYIYLDTNTSLQIDDTVCNTATITPISGDVNTNNNTYTRCDRVSAAYDPNDKHVYPAGDITPGTKLTYTINFENLGNDTAFFVSIMDILSDKLDLSSFEILHSSHASNYMFMDGPVGLKVVRFEFPDIMLADSSSKHANKGFIQFSIKTKNNLPYYTQINNRAGIYFDINPVVLTNYAENRIASPENVGNIIANTSLTIYPNPVTDVLSIQLEKGDYETVKLINNIGQVIMQKQLTGVITQIDMKQLPAGLYYLLVSGKEGSISQKVEKL